MLIGRVVRKIYPRDLARTNQTWAPVSVEFESILILGVIKGTVIYNPLIWNASRLRVPCIITVISA